MDRFRFRVWDAEEKKMYYDIQNLSGYLGISSESRLGFYDNFGALLSDGVNYIIMQSTGIKDKNNKLIFEGDIIKETYMVDDEVLTDITKVEYRTESGAFVMTRDDYPDDISYFDDIDINEIEVVGNIYEGERCTILKTF